jgi:hypothetical protein
MLCRRLDGHMMILSEVAECARMCLLLQRQKYYLHSSSKIVCQTVYFEIQSLRDVNSMNKWMHEMQRLPYAKFFICFYSLYLFNINYDVYIDCNIWENIVSSFLHVHLRFVYYIFNNLFISF